MQYFKSILAKQIAEFLNQTEVEILPLIELPKDEKLGDLSFPTFRFSQGKNPAELANKLKDHLQTQKQITNITSEIKTQGPYVNFYLSKSAIVEYLFNQSKSKDFPKPTKNKVFRGAGNPLDFPANQIESAHSQKILVEFANLNTHKEVHIGHLRNIILGESLCRILEAQKNKVKRVYYINDVGIHVAKVLWYLQEHFTKKQIDKITGDKYGEIYPRAVKEADKSESSKKQVLEVLSKLESKEETTYHLWKKTWKQSIVYLEKIYKQLGTRFNERNYEHQFKEEGNRQVDELIKRKIAKISDGATIVDFKDHAHEELGVFVLRRSDGTALYYVADIALALKRLKEKKDKYLYVVGSDQNLLFRQNFQLYNLIGYDINKFEHISYQLVLLAEGKMSSRKGHVVTLKDAIDQGITQAKKIIKQKRPKIKQKELQKTAEILTLNALKFTMLSHQNQKDIVFDWDILELKDQTAPYIGYTKIRAQKILEKAKKINPKSANPALLTKEEEFILAKKILEYPQILFSAANTRSPHVIANYTIELCQLFSRFYENCPVLDEQEELKQTRLLLVQAFLKLIKELSYLLTLEELKEM